MGPYLEMALSVISFCMTFSIIFTVYCLHSAKTHFNFGRKERKKKKKEMLGEILI